MIKAIRKNMKKDEYVLKTNTSKDLLKGGEKWTMANKYNYEEGDEKGDNRNTKDPSTFYHRRD